VIFLPFTEVFGPVTPLQYLRYFVGPGEPFFFTWTIAAGSLLAIPIALWHVRSLVGAGPSVVEQALAIALSTVAMSPVYWKVLAITRVERMNVRSVATASMTLGLAAFLAGCVGSDEPVIPASEAIFDSRLVGTWVEDDGTRRYVISRLDEGDNAYVIEQSRGRDIELYLAYLGRLGGHLVLEISPHFTGDAPSPGAYQLVVLEFGSASGPAGGHGELQVSMLFDDALIEALESGDVQLAHRVTGRYGEIVLEDSTDVLRDRLAAYLERPGVLKPALDPLRRITDASLAEPRYMVAAPCLQASPWPEADQLFRRDARWLGADAASSLELADGRILWVFDNTRFDAGARGGRWDDGTRIGVTVAIQHGNDPVASPIVFYWGVTTHGEASAFFPWRDDEELSFGGGVRLDDRLLLFFKRSGGGARYAGWTAMLVENANDEPHAWRIRALQTSDDPTGVLLGAAGALRLGRHVYALGPPRHLDSAPVFVARWPVESAREGDLERPEWWAGETLGWVADASTAARAPLFESGRRDLHIQLDPISGHYIVVQCGGSGAPMTVRASSSLVGDWSDPAPLQLPSGLTGPEVLIRNARMHTRLAGSDRLLTVRINARYAWEPPQAAFFPRFLRLNRCAPEPLQARLTEARVTLVPRMTAKDDLPSKATYPSAMGWRDRTHFDLLLNMLRVGGARP
jgi:hypothetical protein